MIVLNFFVNALSVASFGVAHEKGLSEVEDLLIPALVSLHSLIIFNSFISNKICGVIWSIPLHLLGSSSS
jgi:hypothetical protein